MEELISKELLSEVVEKLIITHVALRNNEVWYSSYEPTNGKWTSINIYELAHKCKVWAKSKHYNIIETSEDKYWVIHMKHNIALSFNYGMIEHTGDSIFSCCQWIKENKK